MSGTIQVRTPPLEGPPTWRTANVIERPYPGMAICDTLMPGNYSLTHEKSGMAVVFTASLDDARAAAELLDMIDWTQDGEVLKANPDNVDVVAQVSQRFGELLYGLLGEEDTP